MSRESFANLQLADRIEADRFEHKNSPCSSNFPLQSAFLGPTLSCCCRSTCPLVTPKRVYLAEFSLTSVNKIREVAEAASAFFKISIKDLNLIRLKKFEAQCKAQRTFTQSFSEPIWNSNAILDILRNKHLKKKLRWPKVHFIESKQKNYLFV